MYYSIIKHNIKNALNLGNPNLKHFLISHPPKPEDTSRNGSLVPTFKGNGFQINLWSKKIIIIALLYNTLSFISLCPYKKSFFSWFFFNRLFFRHLCNVKVMCKFFTLSVKSSCVSSVVFLSKFPVYACKDNLWFLQDESDYDHSLPPPDSSE